MQCSGVEVVECAPQLYQVCTCADVPAALSTATGAVAQAVSVAQVQQCVLVAHTPANVCASMSGAGTEASVECTCKHGQGAQCVMVTQCAAQRQSC